MKDADREVCMCFHVPLGKLVKHVRLESPRVASQMTDCYGAGTGCGWCRPFLERIFEQVKAGETPDLAMTEEEYRRRRAAYRETGRREGAPGDPPGATEDGGGDSEKSHPDSLNQETQ